MLYEWRIYEAAPGKFQALHERFQKHAIPHWKKYGITPVGFWTYSVGGPSDQLVYMLQWENMAQMEKAWAAFRVDPEWQKVRAESERDGPLTVRIHNYLLQPTPYSPMQ